MKIQAGSYLPNYTYAELRCTWTEWDLDGVLNWWRACTLTHLPLTPLCPSSLPHSQHLKSCHFAPQYKSLGGNARGSPVFDEQHLQCFTGPWVSALTPSFSPHFLSSLLPTNGTPSCSRIPVLQYLGSHASLCLKISFLFPPVSKQSHFSKSDSWNIPGFPHEEALSFLCCFVGKISAPHIISLIPSNMCRPYHVAGTVLGIGDMAMDKTCGICRTDIVVKGMDPKYVMWQVVVSTR